MLQAVEGSLTVRIHACGRRRAQPAGLYGADGRELPTLTVQALFGPALLGCVCVCARVLVYNYRIHVLGPLVRTCCLRAALRRCKWCA